MIANLSGLIEAIRTEKALGTEMAQQLVQRIDAHIRDLETLKAWVLDAAMTREIAMEMIVGDGDVPPPAAPPTTPAPDAATVTETVQ